MSTIKLWQIEKKSVQTKEVITNIKSVNILEKQMSIYDNSMMWNILNMLKNEVYWHVSNHYRVSGWVIGVSIIRVIWYVFSWILIKTVLTIHKLSDRLQDGIINFVSVLYENIKDAINNQHEYSVRNRGQK